MGRIRNTQWNRYSAQKKGKDAFMYGSIYIKDLTGNIHDQAFNSGNYRVDDDTPKDHVEDVLINRVVKRWTGESKMQVAKVTIAMRDSPCIRCCSRLEQSYKDLRESICGSEGKLYLVFAFAQFYVARDKGGKWAWASETDAKEGYRQLTLESGTGIRESATWEDHRISRLCFWHEPLGGTAQFIGTWETA